MSYENIDTIDPHYHDHSVVDGQLGTLNQTVVLSACTGDPDLDDVHHLLAQRGLQHLGLQTFEAVGQYKGNKERSIVVPVRCHKDVLCVISCAVAYQQEAVLAVDRHGEACLITLADPVTRTLLGDVVQVTARPFTDHTQLGNRHFVTVPRSSEEQEDEPVPA